MSLPLLLACGLLVVGFVILIKGADWLVEGSSSLAKRMEIPPIVIGLTVVAFGTSLPELVVNLFAAMANRYDMALGNVVGSNIFNILLILGVSGLVAPLTITRGTVWREVPFAFLAALVLAILVNDQRLGGEGANLLTRGDGLILLAFFAIFFVYIVSVAQAGSDEESTPIAQLSAGQITLMIGGGLCALVGGGKLIVDNAITIAQFFGLSDQVIGLTIVAAGTSLPELATSVMATYRNRPEIAVGNVVGSNIFNIFFILGITALFPQSIPYATQFNRDLWVLLGTTALLFFFFFTGKRHRIDRWEAAIFLLAYASYTTYLLWTA